MAEAEEEIGKKRKIRALHRSAATKLANKIKQKLDDGSAVEDKQIIIELHGNLEVEDVEARIEKEIEDSDGVREEINGLILRLEEVLIPTGATSPQQMNVVLQSQSENATPSPSKQHVPKAKLPKLEVKKFNGRLQDWQEFWDSFQSSIDKNESLSAVDKFAYLRSLVQEPARSTIAGFALTSANYEAAVQALKETLRKGDRDPAGPCE